MARQDNDRGGSKRRPRPMTAEEKAARAALVQASQAGLEQQQVRVSTQSRGAFKQRALRSGGSELQRYSLGRFKDDPFPDLGTTTGGGGNPGGSPAAPRGRTRDKPKGKPKPTPTRPVRRPTGNEGGGMNAGTQRARERGYLEAERRRLAAEKRAREKAKAEARAKRARERAAERARRAREEGEGVVKSPTGGGFTMS